LAIECLLLNELGVYEGVRVFNLLLDLVYFALYSLN